MALTLRNTAADGLAWRAGAAELLAALRRDGIPLALVTMSYRAYAGAGRARAAGGDVRRDGDGG